MFSFPYNNKQFFFFAHFHKGTKYTVLWLMSEKERLRLHMDYTITRIKMVLETSDVNLWLACNLSNQGFLVEHPVYTDSKVETTISTTSSPSTHKKVRTKDDFVKSMGTAMFARLILWGYHCYTLNDVRSFPSQLHYTNELTTGEPSALPKHKKKNKKVDGIISMLHEKKLPSISTIQKMLQDDLKKLEDEDFRLLQSVLLDTWISHDYAQPIRYEQFQQQSTIDDEPSEHTTPIAKIEPKKSKGALAYRRYSTADVCSKKLIDKPTRF